MSQSLKINHKLSTFASKAKSPILKGSVQKTNICLKLIRGKTINQALGILDRTNKVAASEIKKTLLSAVSNAENNGHYDLDGLFIKNISSGKSLMLKRFHPRARGRIFKVVKHYSRVYLELYKI